MKFLSTIMLIMLITGCSFENRLEFQTNLLNPEQTNQIAVKILSVDEAKEIIIRDIIEGGYALPDRWVLKEHPYLTNLDWGPVVFVENIGNEGLHKFYYVFYGKMPDGAVAVHEAVDAITGEVFRGGLISYSETNKTFLLTPDEAKNYAISKAGISKNVLVKAVYYRDWVTKNYDETFCWKYQIVNQDNSPILIKGNKFPSIFLDPYVVGLDPTPRPDNVINRYFSTRIYALETKVIKSTSMFMKGKTYIETNKVFVSVE